MDPQVKIIFIILYSEHMILGLFLIAGIGVMRTAVIHEDLLTDGVPVDSCSNLTIAAAWRTDKDYW